MVRLSPVGTTSPTDLPLDLSLTWQQVQDVLRVHRPSPTATSELVGLAVYHYCASATLAHPADAVRFDELMAQLTASSRSLPRKDSWTPQQFELAGVLAWLRSQRAPGSDSLALTVLLGSFDHLLASQAHQALHQVDPASRRTITCATRYLGLRLPAAPWLADTLRQLLNAESPLSLLATTRPLGLAGGVAGDLLLRLRLHRLGLPDTELAPYLHTYVAHLLASRREVDFERKQLSIFPDQVSETGSAAELQFSARLSWSRGDLPQVLLLYEAADLLLDDELVRIADLVGLNTLLRTTQLTTEITDSRFYQGAAGVAHLYQRLHQLSGQAAYAQSYLFWLSQTCGWLQRELSAPTSLPVSDLPNGLAGVGLVLLRAITATEFHWDTMLL